jgi:hypothetical protein
MEQNPYESPQWPADVPYEEPLVGEGLEPMEWIMCAVGVGGAVAVMVATIAASNT